MFSNMNNNFDIRNNLSYFTNNSNLTKPEMNQKILAFEYLVSQFILWYQSVASKYGFNPNDYSWAFSKLSTLKLLFLVSAVKTGNNPNDDLLDTFNNFVALPHGPVESDIYNAMNGTLNGLKLSQYNILSGGIKEYSLDNPINYESEIEPEIFAQLNLSLEVLRNINDEIVTYKAFDLVDITHKWSCWKNDSTLANNLGLKAMSMTQDSIRSSDKYFR